MPISALTLFATSSLVLALTAAVVAGFICLLAGTSVNKPAAQRRHVLEILDRLVELIRLLYPLKPRE
ncbi:hypothetical protein [Kribbella sp. C-35]|uniref:hypothetical protein n=1 Tax=Kribbella sp. C-35 TaxID=2789276 RepID=UPI00397D8705